MEVKIITANGETEIFPVYCEITGKHIGWSTKIDYTKIPEYLFKPEFLPDFKPAFISFEVVNEIGYQLIDTSDIETF